MRFRCCRPAFALIAAAWLTGCSHKAVESVATEEDVPVSVEAAVVADTFETTISATGVVAPASGADWIITAPEAARIAELPHSEGDLVNPGDLLVRFEIPSEVADIASREADVRQAAARVAVANANRTRYAGLLERGIAAQRELEAAQLELAQATATAEQAQAALTAARAINERATVRAKFAGVVAKRWHGAGDLVDANGQVLRVIDTRRLEVVASVPVAVLSHVVTGRAARIGEPSGDAVENASVISTPAAVDVNSATAEVRLGFAGSTTLKAGTAVNVTIVTDRLTKVVVIPAVAVLRDGGEVFVMVAGQDDDKAHKTPVVLGAVSGDRVVVKSGLKAGELVIVRGQDGLPDEAGIAVIK
jgi:RND family efflux transporter MFP subunit